MLPPTAAFERDIQALGVAEKMKDRARRWLERSAEQAGFMEQGRNRLVRPGVAVRDEPEPPKQNNQREETQASKKNGGGGDFGDVDPLIIGLFRRLPEAGTEWNSPPRIKWLETAANIFDLILQGRWRRYQYRSGNGDAFSTPAR